MFDNVLKNSYLYFFFQDHKNLDRWSVQFDASNVNRSRSSRKRVRDRTSRENVTVACFTGNSTHVNMVSALQNVLTKILGVGLQMLL